MIKGDSHQRSDSRNDEGTTRREFLKYSSGAVAAASLSSLTFGCGGGNSSSLDEMFVGYPDLPDLVPAGVQPPSEIPDAQAIFALPDPVFLGPTPPPKSGLETFDHVVVIMFENRSFDNLLGYLPAAAATGPLQQSINGVAGKGLYNPTPPYAAEFGFGVVPVSPATSMQTPLIDPGEEYESINVALFNQFNPASNQSVTAEDLYAAPYNLPNSGAYFPPPMDGWVSMFIWTLVANNYPAPTYAQYSTIMQCFPPNMLPAMNLLASSFGVCDNYFCGVPSQTICNRSFFHAAQSSGTLINAPVTNWIGSSTPPAPGSGQWALTAGNTAPTIFDSLTAAGHTWTIYSDADDVISLTGLLHFPTLSKYKFVAPYFKSMQEFHADAAAGNLPDYAFVEPRLFFDDNSYHPIDGAAAAKRGEILLNDVYQSIRQSNTPTGSNFQNTLLMVTFDEGGTTFDHVAPPGAIPPFPNTPGQFGFEFDRLGQRIVSIIVSAYIDAAVVNTQYDSASMLATLQQKFNLPPLTARDAAATSFAGIFNRTTPRPRSEWPRLQVRTLSAAEAQSTAALPLNGLQVTLVEMANSLATHTAVADTLPPGVNDVGTAVAFLQSLPPPQTWGV